MLSATLYTDENSKRYNAIASRHVLSSAEVGNGDYSLLPHGSKNGCQNAAIDGTGYVMVLKSKRIGVLGRFIQDKGANNSAWCNL